MFDVKKPKFSSIERFPKFNFQDLWKKICNNENLTSNIRRTKFCKNLKESLLTSLNLVCNNPICNECHHKYKGLIVSLLSKSLSK